MLSKAIGGSLPLSVVVYREELDCWRPGAHAGTFRGNQMAMAAGSATLRYIRDEGLVEHAPYHGVRLTASGRELALEMMRRHRLIESFLADLGMPWDRVHEEAERLEHVISEELEELIARHLGDPTRDPHGDPIPTASLELDEPDTKPLSEMEPGENGVLARISDSDPAMLRYLSDHGIAPGDRVRVLERQPFGGPLLVSFAEGEREQAIGGQLARAMRIAVAAPEGGHA